MMNKTKEEVFEDSVKVLTELSDISKPYGAVIAWEPIGQTPFCVRSARMGLDIVKAVDRKNVGLTVDVINLYLNSAYEDIEDIKAIPGDKIEIFHINAALDVPLDKMHTLKHRAYPEDGIINVAEICKIVKESGYDGPASLELLGTWMEGNPQTADKEDC